MAPLSNAERQRRYRKRINRDPEKRARYLKKQREYARERRKRGLVKRINDYPKREQERIRRQWRERQRKCRKNKKERCKMAVLLKKAITGGFTFFSTF